jgi:hypothetical protein
VAHDIRDILEVLRFELKFAEDGGYGRSPRAPWRAPSIFEDSPTCPNFNDRGRPLPCAECLLIEFVPQTEREKELPCRLIPLTQHGETIEDLYRSGTQEELEEALTGWLRRQIRAIERERSHAA